MDSARLTQFDMRRSDDGAPGYTIENPFGEIVQVLPRPPAFEAVVTFAWEGAMPDEIVLLLERARAVGLVA